MIVILLLWRSENYAEYQTTLFLGIDVGTQGLRSGIFDARGNVVALSFYSYLNIILVRDGQNKILLIGGKRFEYCSSLRYTGRSATEEIAALSWC